MRILFVISGLGYGGAESQLIALAMELRRLGHEPDVYVLTDHAPRVQTLIDAGVPVRVDHKSTRLDLGVLIRLRCHIRATLPDVIHGFLFDGNWYSTVAAIGLVVPVYCSERSSNYRLSLTQWLGLWTTRRFVSGVIANSELGCRQAVAMYGLPVHRGHVVWNGLDLSNIDARVRSAVKSNRPPDNGITRRTAIVVGSFRVEKDQLLALEVAERLRRIDSNWQMWFVGDSFERLLNYSSSEVSASVRYLSDFQRRMRELGLEDMVILTGQRNDVLELMAAADVLLSTSRREGSPNVVLEAMAVGLPVVATEFSDIRRLLPFDWQVVPDRSPDRLADAVCRAVVQRLDVIDRQRAWVEANATIEGAARQSLQIYSGHQEGIPGVGSRGEASS